jgi:serine/threonine protein kinase
MNESAHERVQEILEQAVRYPADDREACVQAACGDDSELLAEVRSLLPHYVQMRDFELGSLSEWMLPGTTTLSRAREDAQSESELDALEPPFCIDQYQCDEVLGRGGMGIVYLATHATLRKQFAIKLLRTHLSSSTDRWRFAFEVELLRRLQHPGIARLLYGSEVKWPGGTQPFFVMEFVCGQQLVQYADEVGLNSIERLVLLANVCEPIEYAHQRGIVHRDLKPGNILVDTDGSPKILDFGIALVSDSAATFGHDDAGQFVGTYEYASPEQIAGQNKLIDSRSDVYSLGLITHELLTGRLPRSIDGQVRLDLDRVRVHDGPPGLAARQKEFLYYLRIVFSASLARDRNTRYRSAGELGAALNAIATEFVQPYGWSAIRARLSRLFSSADAERASTSKPLLAALLRKRLSMWLETSRPEQQADQSASDQPADESDDDEIYRLRETES